MHGCFTIVDANKLEERKPGLRKHNNGSDREDGCYHWYRKHPLCMVFEKNGNNTMNYECMS